MRELLATLALVALFLFDPRTALQRPAARADASPRAQQAPQRRPAPVHHAARTGAARTAIAIARVTESKNPAELMLGLIPRRDDLSSSKDTVFLSFGKRLTFGSWFFGSGVAAAKGDDEVLSGTFQFLTGVSYQRERWTLGLRHLSNAGLTGRNRGETVLLATWAW